MFLNYLCVYNPNLCHQKSLKSNETKILFKHPLHYSHNYTYILQHRFIWVILHLPQNLCFALRLMATKIQKKDEDDRKSSTNKTHKEKYEQKFEQI